MADITVRVNEQGQFEGDVPELLQQVLKKQFDQGFGKGAEKTAKEAMAQLETEKKRLSQGDPVEREKARQMETELEALRLEKAEREKRYEDAIKMREDAHSKALKAEKDTLKRYEAKVRDLLGSEIRAAAIAAGARQESLPELVKLLGADIGLTEDLQPVVLNDKDEVLMDKDSSQPVSIEAFVQQYLQTHPHHRSAPSPGGGARGGTVMTTGTAFDPTNAAAAAALAKLEADRSPQAINDAFEALRAARAPKGR